MLGFLQLVAIVDDAGISEQSANVRVADAGPAPYLRMTELLDEAVKKMAVLRHEEALAQLQKKNYPGALEYLKQAYDLDPKDPEIVHNLGYIYQLLGKEREAETYFREAIQLEPSRLSNYLNLAELLGREGESEERLNEAARLLAKARGQRGNQHKVILKQARVARLQGADDDAERFYDDYLNWREPSNDLKLEIGDFYRDTGRPDDALSWYRLVDDEEDLGRKSASRIWEIEVENQARKFGWARDPETIPTKARMLARKGRVLLNQGNLAEAKRFLADAIALAPAFAMARADMGNAFKEEGAFQEAEVAYLKALALDSGNAEICVRLGQLYLAMEEEGRAVEAALFLARALDLRPDWINLHFTLAEALRASGDLDGAMRHLDTFLARIKLEEEREKALALRRTIEGLRTSEGKGLPASVLGTRGTMDREVSGELISSLNRARTHLAKGRLDAAMAELKMLPRERQSVLVLNLEARILHSSGRTNEAAELLIASTELEPIQPQVQEQLGMIFLEQGRKREALERFKKAEAQGSGSAVFHLVKMELGEEDSNSDGWYRDLFHIKRLLHVRSRLERFLRQGSTSVYLSEARSLYGRISDRLQTVYIVFGTAVVSLLFALFLTVRRIRGGADLEELISRHPEAGPDVQRVLSAIRHEVLKHNTMVIGGLVEAMERGESASDKANHFLDAFFGGSEGESLVEKLEAYTVELFKTGRSYGVRLNLKGRDPALSVLFRGFAIIQKIAPRLARLDELGKRKRAALLKALSNASLMLNVEGYQAVQRLFDQIRALDVDEEMIFSIAEKVRREASFAQVKIAPVTIESSLKLPCRVLISYQAFEDIMANLIRNAFQSSLDERGSLPEVGISIGEETDSITGSERVVFTIKDRANKPLTTEMLRGRNIKGGLGLATELITRYEGTVDVIPGGIGWAKSVRVRLPMAPVAVEQDA